MNDKLRFTRYDFDGSVSISALLQPNGPLCGIYRLEFDDGTEYVGQSINFLSRFATHRRHQEGRIVAVSFANAASEDLDTLERKTIQQRENDGAKLRNFVFTRLPSSGPALDLVFDKAAQEAWLSDDDTSLTLGERRNVEAATDAQVAQFTKLKQRSDFAKIIEFLADYIEKAIPSPHLTERKFWTVTAYPTTGSPYGRRVAVLSINNVEVLYCFEVQDKKTMVWKAFWVLNIDPSVRMPLLLRFETSLSDGYVSVGRVRQLFCDISPFGIPAVAYAARSLAMGLLRKGQGMMRRYHNPLLADAIFAELERRVSIKLMPPEPASDHPSRHLSITLVEGQYVVGQAHHRTRTDRRL